MTSLSRQNTLFVSEDWVRIYEALQNIDFRAFDFDNLVQALMDYLRTNYSDQFNDWIASSEFVTKIEVLAWLSQNIQFRVDLNIRENFLATAERRDSLLRLAQNIAYKVNRVRGAAGDVRLSSIRTTQSLVDSTGTTLQDVEVFWNDPSNPNWFEQFVTIMNKAFVARTPFGRPLVRYQAGTSRIDQYVFNSRAPSGGVYPFSATVNGTDLSFEVVNSVLDATTGIDSEIAPKPTNAFRIRYKLDGKGTASTGTGFFLPIKQGTLTFVDEEFTAAVPVRTVTLTSANINNDDLFIQEIDENGNVLAEWTKVDTVFGDNVAFNTETASKVFEVDTLINDNVLIRFGDGKFGEIPLGRFRFWYRTSSATASIVKPDNIVNETITIPYLNNDQLFYLTMRFGLTDSLINASQSETDLDIRTRANLVFYTQNRMVTSRDYNSFFLRDNSIKKIKTINRTFSGQSRYARSHDPTGLYENVKVLGEDGRLYQESVQHVQFVPADPELTTIDILVNQYIKPTVRSEDKKLLYYTSYRELYLTTAAEWNLTSTVAKTARGQIVRANVPQVVGSSLPTTDPLRYVAPDAVLRTKKINGPVVAVERVTGNGTGTDGILLRGLLPDARSIIAVMPAFRNELTTQEVADMKLVIAQKLTFGLTWNQLLQKWQIINNQNINLNGAFNLTNQGSTGNVNSDASWLVYVQFVPGTNGNEDQWKIVDRGVGVFFESVREVGFYYAGSKRIVDITGQSVFDNIKVLGINESRNSLRRRGLAKFLTSTCGTLAFQFIGDGITTCFKGSESPLDAAKTVVLLDGFLQINNVDYTISPDAAGDSICFFDPPPLNSVIEVRISDAFVYAKQTVNLLTGDNSLQSLGLGVSAAIPSNVVSTLDGVFQNPGRDYTVTQVSSAAAILYDVPVPTGVRAVAYTLGEATSQIFVKSDYIADGIQGSFALNSTSQSIHTVMVMIDGIYQTPTLDFVIDNNTNPSNSVVTFTTPPPAGTKLVLYAAKIAQFLRAKAFSFTGDGTTVGFTLTGLRNLTGPQLIVSIDGVMQIGPGLTGAEYAINNNQVVFVTPPPSTTRINVYVIVGAVGTATDITDFDEGEEPDDLDVESCFVSYIGSDAIFAAAGELRHSDGYPNKAGLLVAPADVDQDGLYDNPYLFKDIVLADGTTDLVIWRKVTEFGATVWQALSTKTAPQGTYGRPAITGILLNAAVDNSKYNYGDIHYDLSSKKFLVADSQTDTWILVTNQSDYKTAVGRDDLRFLWTHYAPDANRIDPATGNVHDAYVLTSTFDSAYRTWVSTNGSPADEPIAPTPEELRIQYQEFDDFKVSSDSIIYHPARYHLLFGPKSSTEVQATFKVIKTPGSRISDNDLRLRILRTIENFFDLDRSRWDFGEVIYFTELASFVHAQLAPDVQTFVIVPKDTTQTFGRLFQIRLEPDELPLSATQPSDVEIVQSLTDAELRIGTF